MSASILLLTLRSSVNVSIGKYVFIHFPQAYHYKACTNILRACTTRALNPSVHSQSQPLSTADFFVSMVVSPQN